MEFIGYKVVMTLRTQLQIEIVPIAFDCNSSKEQHGLICLKQVQLYWDLHKNTREEKGTGTMLRKG